MLRVIKKIKIGIHNTNPTKESHLDFFNRATESGHTVKPGIHYVIFALIFPRFYSLNKLTLVEESQSQAADYSWQIPQKIT